ncbi:MAG: DUF6612 family protein [Bacillota bacterium]|nr:DUF6612 family protein [Bacillota bacterium]MDW7678077.1 DUF6612 family protein [Bacillota bacterium]
MKAKRMIVLLIITALIVTMAVPAAAAGHHGMTLKINGIEMTAAMEVVDGRAQIANAFLNKLPGLTVSETGYTPLREFFEADGATVVWDGTTRTIDVTWRNSSGEWNARDLMLRSNELLMEYNTYQMTGSMVMDMIITAAGMEMPTGPMEVTFDAAMQYDPLNMYVRQEMDMAAMMMSMAEELGETEDMPEGLDGPMVTELLWTEEAIYQKMPLSDQWIRMDLAGMDTMNMLTQMMQTSPQQSMELMDAFGMLYVFGEDVEMDGREYYTLSTYVDADTYRKVFEEMMGGMNFAEMVPAEEGMTDEEAADMQAELSRVIDAMMATMTMDYYIDSYINKETLLTDRMDIDMMMTYSMDETVSPEGPVTMAMKMTGSYEMHSYGEPIELPDVSDSITTEEMMQLQLEEQEELEQEAAELDDETEAEDTGE